MSLSTTSDMKKTWLLKSLKLVIYLRILLTWSDRINTCIQNILIEYYSNRIAHLLYGWTTVNTDTLRQEPIRAQGAPSSTFGFLTEDTMTALLQTLCHTHCSIFKMWISFTLPSHCLPPNNTTLHWSTLVKVKAAQGAGGVPVHSGTIHLSTHAETYNNNNYNELENLWLQVTEHLRKSNILVHTIPLHW